MTDTWIVLGATSSIARAFIRDRAEAGCSLILCGRDFADMEATAADARLRTTGVVEVAAFDARQPETYPPILALTSGMSGLLNCAVFVGTMPEQVEIDADPELIEGTITDSFTGPARFLTMLAPHLEARGGGAIVGVGSVAGDRGRLGNYVYGAAKAGFHTYLSGLRNRLARSGVHVMTVKPGPVDTAMTWGLPPMPLMTSPAGVTRDILRGLRRKRNVIYTAGIWRVVMTVIRLIPEPVFKKLKI